MSITAVARGAPVAPDRSLEIGVSELREYVMKRDHSAETEADRSRLRASFADYERSFNNMDQPEMAQAFAVGGQMVAVYQAMSTAAAAGMTISTAVPAVGAAVLLISMFAAWGSGGSDAVQQLQRQMRDNFMQVNAKLAEMERFIRRNHAEDLHEFTKVRYDIGVAREDLGALLGLTKDEVREIRGDLHIQVKNVTDRIKSVASEISYFLNQLSLDKLKNTVEAIENYELREVSDRMPVEKLRKKVAYLEKWLSAPTGNEMLTGEYFAGTSDQGKYIQASSIAGRIGLLTIIFRKDLIADKYFSRVVDLGTFNDILLIYAKAVKFLRAAGENYDAGGKMWDDKVVEPLEASHCYGNSLYLNYEKYAKAIYGDMQISYDAALKAAKGLLKASSQELADGLERELVEERGRIFLDMARPLNGETEDNINWNGGWYVAIPGGHAGMVKGRLPAQRKELLDTYAALEVTPFDLFDMGATKVNLKGRFARLLPAHKDVYLYPTYLPLQVLPITTAIRAGLEAEKLGLGRLRVEASLVGRFQNNYGRWLYAPGHLKDCTVGPTDPYWISLQWTFIDTKLREYPLQDDCFSLNFHGCEHCPGAWINNGVSGERDEAWVWNGDALAGSSMIGRWTSNRVDLKEESLEETFSSCETSAAVYGDRSRVIRFPAKRVSKWVKVNAMRDERVMELRLQQLYSPSIGDPIKKEVFKSSLEAIKESHLVIHALKEHVLGPQTCTALRIMEQDQLTSALLADSLPPLDLPPKPDIVVSAYWKQYATSLTKAELLRAEILAVPVPPRRALPEAAAARDPLIDILAAQVKEQEKKIDELREMLIARDAVNNKLIAQLTALLGGEAK